MGEVKIMKDLSMLVKKCTNLLDEANIPYVQNIQWKVNTRAVRRWGLCQKDRYTGKYTIQIAERLLNDSVEDKATETTILHEMIHSAPGCLNHGNTWQNYANKVNSHFGYNIKRCTSYEEKQIEKPKAKYFAKCTGCGRVVGKYKMCSIVKYPEHWRCGVCNSSFERYFKIP